MSKIFNNALFEAKERESAVSPVVGVMLMLVVTIVIAATVSAFAGGLVGTTSKAPQAAFDVKIAITHQSWGDIDRTMTITHLGGDQIDTARTKLVTSWTNKTTKEDNYRETTALPPSDTAFTWTDYDSQTCSAYINMLNANVNETDFKYQEPYFVIPGILPTNHRVNETLWFGNYVLQPGDVMKSQSSLSYGGTYNTNIYGYKDHSVIKNSMMLSGKDVVNVKLIDIPTGQIIFDKDIYVMEG